MGGIISTDIGTEVIKSDHPLPSEPWFSQLDWITIPIGTTLEVTRVEKIKGNDVIHLQPVPRTGVEILLPMVWFNTTYLRVTKSGQQYPLFLPPTSKK